MIKAECEGCIHLTEEGCKWAYDGDRESPNPPQCYNFDEGELEAVVFEGRNVGGTMAKKKVVVKICRHCKDARLDTDNMIGPYRGLRCPACNHYHLLKNEGTKEEEFILMHDNHCGCDHLGREKSVEANA